MTKVVIEQMRLLEEPPSSHMSAQVCSNFTSNEAD